MPTLVGFNYLKNPILKLAKDMVAAGELGEITNFRGIHAEDYMADPLAPWSWRCEPPGGGALAELIVDSLTDDNTNWTGGAANVFSGVVHFPNSNVKMAGGNTTSGGGACFSLIANRITLTGGAAAGSACKRMSDSGGSGGADTIRLVR